jgi:hypothetical protein
MVALKSSAIFDFGLQNRVPNAIHFFFNSENNNEQ